MSDWLQMTAMDLGKGIEDGKIDPRDLTDAYLAEISANPHRNRIYARITKDRAHAEADAAADRARRGLRLSPLDGVPISWKDLYDTAGVETEAGSALLEGRLPSKDAVVLERATAKGLVCLGKTHMTELAFSGLGVNPVTATPPNINNPALAPGGSSSGAATSVAFGLAAAGIGSDTGGSVRIPSVWNDLVGLKTTHGLLPLDGVVPLCAKFDTVGPLCRSVEDASMLTAIMGGVEAPDISGGDLRGARFLAAPEAMLADVREGPMSAYDEAVAALEAAGARVDRMDLPEIGAALPLSPVLFAKEAYDTWGDEIEADPELVYAPIRERFLGGKNVSEADYAASWETLRALRASYQARVAEYDAVLAPTAPNSPPNVARLLSDEAYFMSENLLTLRNTRVANLLGLCALTLPTTTPSCGLMLMAGPMREAELCRIGVKAAAILL
jgi:aspartyl-tRNA(Asn)/glutamyl-tRNA(Gln) amidotransferase subunit A